jgi:hypothetical protein
VRGWLLAALLLPSAASLLWPSAAQAHGGLPISSGILRQGETMYVPVVFWGLWIGSDKGPWTWICEEEMNSDRLRRYALTTDGSFFVTDNRGVTLSTDHGCTWTPAAGEIATLRTSDIAADLSDGATAWVTTNDVESTDGGNVADNALFVTRDHGATFTRVAALDGNGRRFESLKLGSSVIYVTSTALAPPYSVTVHQSRDGGSSFTAHALTYTVDGAAPYAADLLALDPRDPDGVWIRGFYSVPGDGGIDVPLQVLLRSADAGATATEVWRMVGETTPSGATRGIDGVAVDGPHARVFVATAQGLLAGDDAGGPATVTLAPTGGLSIAQCVEVHGDAIYVCSSNYAPDLKALARSDDGGKSFVQVLSYQNTVGPVDCPASTPVGSMCPYYWQTYSAQLGIGGGGLDAGTGGGGGGACSCSFTPRATVTLIMPLLLAVVLLFRRRGAK